MLATRAPGRGLARPRRPGRHVSSPTTCPSRSAPSPTDGSTTSSSDTTTPSGSTTPCTTGTRTRSGWPCSDGSLRADGLERSSHRPAAGARGRYGRVLTAEQSNTSRRLRQLADPQGLPPGAERHQPRRRGARRPGPGGQPARRPAVRLDRVPSPGSSPSPRSSSPAAPRAGSSRPGACATCSARATCYAEEVGGDFAGEAYRLGEVTTAEVHAAMRETAPHRLVGPAELRGRADELQRRLDRCAASRRLSLRPFADAVLGVYEELAALADPGAGPAGARRPAPRADDAGHLAAGRSSTSRASRPGR